MKLSPRMLLLLFGVPAGYLPFLAAVETGPAEVGVTLSLLTAFGCLVVYRTKRAADQPKWSCAASCVAKIFCAYACCLLIGILVSMFFGRGSGTPIQHLLFGEPSWNSCAPVIGGDFLHTIGVRFCVISLCGLVSCVAALAGAPERRRRRRITFPEGGATIPALDQPVSRLHPPLQFTIGTILAVTGILAVCLSVVAYSSREPRGWQRGWDGWRQSQEWHRRYPSPLLPAGGTVIYEGKPHSSANIRFYPALTHQVLYDYERTDASGNFTMRGGLMAGDYVVTIGSSDARTIPLRYSSANDSGLKATIVAGGENQFRFELHAEPE